jgi:mannose/cellobiose epimerase-like protein (N-acyl-D-glucosamine 2-epimerase family)
MDGGFRLRTAELLEEELRERMVPYWSGLLDRRRGGFRLADEAGGSGPLGRLRQAARARLRPTGGTVPSPLEKHLVGQSRVVYALSLAARLGHDPGGAGLAAAAAGCRFLVERLADGGGFVWTADRRGRPRVRDKLLYGHAFALLALVEHHRASGEGWPLERARRLFALLTERFADRQHGGWHEHLTADLVPCADSRRLAAVRNRPGWKSHDAHLHLLEALADLHAVTADPAVAAALRETLAWADRFLPAGGGPACALLVCDGAAADDPAARRVLHGHRLEHAWLSLRVAAALGEAPPWPRALAVVDDVLAEGFEPVRGGVWQAGRGGESDGVRESWVQAEALLALSLAAHADDRYLPPLERQLAWIDEHHRTPSGAWLAAIDAAGRCVNPTLAGSWKAGYHEVRAVAFTAAVLRGDPAPWH